MDPAGHCLASRKLLRVAIGPGEEDSALIRQSIVSINRLFHEYTARGDETIGLQGFPFHESFKVMNPLKPTHFYLDTLVQPRLLV